MDSEKKFLAHKAYNMRVNSLKMTTKAGSGHPTSSLSAAEIVAVLFFQVMKFNPKDPQNPNNDRFILSKGHASPIFYAVYKELGYLSQEQLMTYREFGSELEGHPTPRFAWTEAATGSLGQGLSVGVGMALNAKMDKRDYYTYILLGDGEVAEGSVWEAAELAAYYKLNNLIAIIDVNRLGQTGVTMEGYDLEDYAKKFTAFGWNTVIVDGHNLDSIMKGFQKAKCDQEKPVILIAKTIKGYGVERIEGKNGYHGKPFSKDELPEILKRMEDRFKEASEKVDYVWKPNLPKAESLAQTQFITMTEPSFAIGDELPTRKAFGRALVELGKQSKEIVVLDGDVSNSTYTEYFGKEFPARFIESFIAEQNMVGMAVGFEKRGKVPFAATFGAFFSRAFDQIRMAAIGKAALRLVGSHAGVSIGQDGPSQMALEDIAMMRTLPDSVVLYPCDAVSTWKLVGHMANRSEGITYLRTTRMATPIVYEKSEEFKIGGCKVLKKSEKDQVCLVAAGVTLFESLKAYELLKKEGIEVSVIDLYSIKPIDRETIRDVVASSKNRVITIEDHYQAGGLGEAVLYELRNEGITYTNLSVRKLPRSGKPDELLAYEEINAQSIVKAVMAILK